MSHATNRRRGECQVEALRLLPTEVAPEFREWRRGGVLHEHGTQSRIRSLSDMDMRFLRAVIANPGQPSHVLPKLLRVSARRAIVLRRSLIERGYLCEHKVATGGRGRAAVVLEPLPAALEALRDQAPDPAEPLG